MNTDDKGNVIKDSSLTVNNTVCPECGSTEFELKNYSMMWHDGEIYCAKCGKYIRLFDAG
jgi:uncharacterized Zn finger protein (UPF0148 family)